jgi:hypothetical protein
MKWFQCDKYAELWVSLALIFKKDTENSDVYKNLTNIAAQTQKAHSYLISSHAFFSK